MKVAKEKIKIRPSTRALFEYCAGVTVESFIVDNVNKGYSGNRIHGMMNMIMASKLEPMPQSTWYIPRTSFQFWLDELGIKMPKGRTKGVN